MTLLATKCVRGGIGHGSQRLCPHFQGNAPLDQGTPRRKIHQRRSATQTVIAFDTMGWTGDTAFPPRSSCLGQSRTCRQRRCATTVNNPTREPRFPGVDPFPYPLHASPSPHQIFHLPRGATQAQIKSRYYELVRCHHPDSHHCRLLSPPEAHSRFQSITAAYDYLRGRTSSPTPGATTWANSNLDPYLHELARRRRAHHASQEGTSRGGGFSASNGPRASDFHEDGKKERIILAFGVLSLIVGLYPSFILFPFHLEKTHRAAVTNLTQARDDAREMGEERRVEIKRRVQDMQVQNASAHADSNQGHISVK